MTIQIGDAAANPAFTDVVQQGVALAALNATNTVQLRGQSTVSVQVTAIGTQTLTFEGTTDGANFFTVNMFALGGTFGGAPVTTTTTTGQWMGVVAGLYQFRVRCSAYTSGSATTSAVASQGTNEQQVTTGTAQASTTAGQIGQLVQGAVTTAAPTYVTAQVDPLSLTTAGGLRSDLASVNATALGTPTNFGTTPGAVNALQVNSSTFIATTAAVASSAGVQKVGIAGGVAGAAIDGAIAAVPPANALQIAIKAATANPTNATAGNQVAIMGDKAGRAVVTTGNVRELIGVQTTVITASTAETTIITAGAAGVFNDLSHISITTTDAAAAVITIKDATAGTTRLTFNYPNAALAPTDALVCDFSIPISQAVAASNWTATVSVNAGTVSINCVYVKNL